MYQSKLIAVIMANFPPKASQDGLTSYTGRYMLEAFSYLCSKA